MRYEGTEKLTEKEFRRLTGVKRETFGKMVEILANAEAVKRRKGGHKSKLSNEDKLLLTLEYLREYRTYFHIAQEFGIHETMALRISRWVEETLIKDGAFSLPGKKQLAKSEVQYEVILIDATESPVERPKRGRNFGIPERKSDTR
jgi:transposase-like protein